MTAEVYLVGDPLDDEEWTNLRSAYLRLNELGRHLTRAIEAVTGAGLSGNADIAVLVRLQTGPLRPRELIETTGLSSAGVSSLGDRLEAHQLVRRDGRVAGDGRAVAFRLTPAGRRVVEKISDAICAEFDAQTELRREVVLALGLEPPPANEMSAGSDQVIEQMAQIGSRAVRAMRVDEFADDPAPGPTAIVLAAAGAARPRDLIKMTGLSSGGVTLLLDRLEEQDLISRTTGRPPDRRAVTVDLTTAGRIALERGLSRVAPLSEAIATAIT